MGLLDGKAIPTEKLRLERGEWTLSALRRLVQASLGKRGRIWEDDGGFVVGLDLKPGRKSLAWGACPEEAVERAFDPFCQEFKKPQPPRSSPGTAVEGPRTRLESTKGG